MKRCAARPRAVLKTGEQNAEVCPFYARARRGAPPQRRTLRAASSKGRLPAHEPAIHSATREKNAGGRRKTGSPDLRRVSSISRAGHPRQEDVGGADPAAHGNSAWRLAARLQQKS